MTLLVICPIWAFSGSGQILDFNLIQYIQYRHALDSMCMKLQLFLNWADFKGISDYGT